MRRRRWFSLVAAIVLFSPVAGHLIAGASTQDSGAASAAQSSLAIHSVPESAFVVMDGTCMGTTPMRIDSIRPGIHLLVLQPPDLESWLAEPASDTIRLAGGEHKELRYNLRAKYFIRSIPFGAEVVLGDSVVGVTPIILSPAPTYESFILRKAGYEPESIPFTDTRIGTLSISLKREWYNDGGGEPYVKDSGGTGSGSLGLYISGAATIVSGVAAAYLKIKADDRYQQYLSTNDGRFLSQTHRLDTAAGVAIFATQLGLGLFTYFIFTR